MNEDIIYTGEELSIAGQLPLLRVLSLNIDPIPKVNKMEKRRIRSPVDGFPNKNQNRKPKEFISFRGYLFRNIKD